MHRLTSLAVVAFLGIAVPAIGAPVITTDENTTGYPVSASDLLQTNLAPVGGVTSNITSREGEQGVTALNDGAFGNLGGQNAQNGAALGAATGGSGNFVTYALDVSTNVNGYNITSLASFAGWDGARYGQNYTVSFNLVGTNSGLFTTPITVNYQPGALSASSTDTSAIVTPDVNSTFLVTGVDAVKFSFANADNVPAGTYQGYRELDVFGTPAALPEPASLSLLAVAGLTMLRRRRA